MARVAYGPRATLAPRSPRVNAQLRRSTTRAAAVILVAALAVVGCSADVTGQESSQRQLDSVMVGADRVLPTADAEAVRLIGVDLLSLVAPLGRVLDVVRSPGPAPAAEVAAARDALAVMTTVIARIDGRLGPDRVAAVRDTYEPYVAAWRAVVKALDAGVTAAATGDASGTTDALAAYDRAIGTLEGLDRARVARVVAVYGHDDAVRLLREQGIDPIRFGL
jgi:hypothetical protein